MKSRMEFVCSVPIQMRATEHYFPLIVLYCATPFEPVDNILNIYKQKLMKTAFFLVVLYLQAASFSYRALDQARHEQNA